MEKIIIGGEALDCGFFGISSAGNMQLIIKNKSVAEIAALFSDQEKTKQMIYDNGDQMQEFNGYTVLINIANQAEGVRVAMRRKFVGEE